MSASRFRRYEPNRRNRFRFTPLSISVVVVMVVAVVFLQRAYYRSEDKSTCFREMPGAALDGNGQILPWSKQPEAFQVAVQQCVEHRRGQRSRPFGAFESRAGTLCEQRWEEFGRLNRAGPVTGLRVESGWPTRDDAERAAAIPKAYGIEETLDSTSKQDKERFMTGCKLIKTRELRRSNTLE